MSLLAKEWALAPPFVPAVSISWQPVVASVLLLLGFLLTALFSLTDKSGPIGLFKQVAIAIPASVLFGFGVVYLLCSVGVYV
ncbi:hypothetical protein V1514DRAFT_329528 [Lipomyces japonicus]|uniref:uncharacterized protein n=1 Tax=Lipomyces japonicus TaxID=56871 RepID=UPI0034CE3C37